MKAALRLLLVTTTLILAGPTFAEVLSTAKPEPSMSRRTGFPAFGQYCNRRSTPIACPAPL